MKNGKSPTLGKNWMYSHKPAPGSFREYNPKRPEYATWEPRSDVSGLGGTHDTGVQLRAVQRAARAEQQRLERAYR